MKPVSIISTAIVFTAIALGAWIWWGTSLVNRRPVVATYRFDNSEARLVGKFPNGFLDALEAPINLLVSYDMMSAGADLEIFDVNGSTIATHEVHWTRFYDHIDDIRVMTRAEVLEMIEEHDLLTQGAQLRAERDALTDTR